MRVVTVVSLFLALPLAAPLAAQHELFRFPGSQAGDRFGSSVAHAGDVDKDGFADVIAGGHLASPNGQSRAGMARVFSGRSGRVLYSYRGGKAGDRLGAAVGGAGDVNKDGYDDLLIGSSYASPGTRSLAGHARVFSGKTGTLLYTILGDAAGDGMGTSLAGTGDLNGDGHDDFVVGAFGVDRNNKSNVGMARVHSGKDNSVLFTFYGDNAIDSLGREVAGAGDVNKDGTPDIIAAAPNATKTARYAGFVRVYSGKDGKVLHTFCGQAMGDQLGSSVAGAGDVNKDGHADIIAGAAGASPGGRSWAGMAQVFSGKDGKVLHTFAGAAAGESLGSSVAPAGDVDKDGHADLLVGSPGASPNNKSRAGIVRLYSGRTGQVLRTFAGENAGEAFGGAVAGGFDVNRDGLPDAIAGAPAADPKSRTDAGLIRVFSAQKLTMWGNTHAIYASVASSQKLTLDAGATHANRLYWIFGSISGTSPGVQLGGVTIPLIPDVWTDITIQLANSPALVRTRGTLDASGKATAELKSGPLNSSAVGAVLYHAALVYDASNTYYLASNPVSLLIEK